MPNVFSKLALQEWGLSLLPHVMKVVKTYSRHRLTIQRSILFLFIFRALMSMRQLVKAFQKSQKSDMKKKVKLDQQQKKKVEVKEIPLLYRKKKLNITIGGYGVF